MGDEVMDLTLNEKIYGLSLIWKEAEYNSPFWKRLPDLDWDRETLPRVIDTKDTREYYLELMRFISLMKDAHTGVFMPENLKENIGFYPFHLKLIDGNHYVDYLDRKYGVKPYSKVLRINDIEIGEYIETKLFPYCWHEKPDSAYDYLNFLIRWVENGRDLKIETDNGTFIAERVFGDTNPNYTGGYAPSCAEFVNEIYSSASHTIKSTADDIVYIKIPNFYNDLLPEQFAVNVGKIKDCKGFIIDLRDNGGGGTNNSNPIARYFFDEPVINYAKDRKMIHIGTYKAYGQWCNSDEELRENVDQKTYDICKRQYFEEQYFSFGNGDGVHFNQPVVILVNENTMSAAEDFLIIFKNRRATIVGTHSYGSTGMGVSHMLPGGGHFRICTRWCAYADDAEYINIGIAPDIYAELSLDDYLNFNDSVLKKALSTFR